METVIKLLGERIRKLRQERGMSQEELAYLSHTNQGHIARIESGKNNTTLDVVVSIAEGLGISVSELFDFKTEPRLPVDDGYTLKVLAYMRVFDEADRARAARIIRALKEKE